MNMYWNEHQEQMVSMTPKWGVIWYTEAWLIMYSCHRPGLRLHKQACLIIWSSSIMCVGWWVSELVSE